MIYLAMIAAVFPRNILHIVTWERNDIVDIAFPSVLIHQRSVDYIIWWINVNPSFLGYRIHLRIIYLVIWCANREHKQIISKFSPPSKHDRNSHERAEHRSLSTCTEMWSNWHIRHIDPFAFAAIARRHCTDGIWLVCCNTMTPQPEPHSLHMCCEHDLHNCRTLCRAACRPTWRISRWTIWPIRRATNPWSTDPSATHLDFVPSAVAAYHLLHFLSTLPTE